MKYACARCGKSTDRPAGHIKRQRAIGAPLYCGRQCAGLARRKHISKADRIKRKAAYDVEYRRKNIVKITAGKHARHLRVYDPEKERIKRKKNMPRHVAYCRRPEYRKIKSAYDKRYRAKKYYGEFAEAFIACVKLNKEIKQRSTNYEIRQEQGTYGKSQKRRSEDGTHKRRRNHAPAYGE